MLLVYHTREAKNRPAVRRAKYYFSTDLYSYDRVKKTYVCPRCTFEGNVSISHEKLARGIAVSPQRRNVLSPRPRICTYRVDMERIRCPTFVSYPSLAEAPSNALPHRPVAAGAYTYSYGADTEG